MGLVAHLSRLEPALRVAEGLLCLRMRVGPVAVLRPVTDPDELPEAARAPDTALVVTDLLGWPRPPRRRARWSGLDAIRRAAVYAPASVLVRDAPEAVDRLRRLPADVIVTSPLPHPAVMGTQFAHSIWSKSERWFIACLPRQLDPDLRLALLGLVLERDSIPQPDDLARRSDRPVERLERDLRRSGVLSAAELCDALKLCRAVEGVRAGVAPGAAARVCGFTGLDEFERTARALTGIDGASFFAEGGVPRILGCLRKRWSIGALPERVSRPSRSSGECAHLSDAEEERFARVYHRGRTIAMDGARSRGAPKEVAEDVAQDTFTRLLTAAPSVWKRDLSDGYFFQAGVHGASNALGRKHQDDLSLSELPERCMDRSTASGPLGSLDHEEPGLLALVADLREPSRTVVRLRLHDWPHGEIAEVLGMSTGSVAQRYSRARSWLRERAREMGYA